MSECTHECGSCQEECGERNTNPADFLEKSHSGSRIKKVIGVVSGKGGVGKSLVTSMLAVLAARRGLKTGILDADVTGPSIPRVFGLKERARGSEEGIFPVTTKTGISVMSANLLLGNDTDPLIWRGPMIAGAVKQFWTDVVWGDIDVLFVDMPPGTGDVALTVFQSIPVDGVVMVTSPQDLVAMIVEKAVKMAEMMKVPVIGLVENMSGFVCPDCAKEYPIFGESHIAQVAQRHALALLARVPVTPAVATACDQGAIELFQGDWLNGAMDTIENWPVKSV